MSIEELKSASTALDVILNHGVAPKTADAIRWLMRQKVHHQNEVIGELKEKIEKLQGGHQLEKLIKMVSDLHIDAHWVSQRAGERAMEEDKVIEVTTAFLKIFKPDELNHE